MMELPNSPSLQPSETSEASVVVDLNLSSDLTERLLAHDEPECPSHPGLEFEVLEQPLQQQLLENASSKSIDPTKDLKLLISFVCLVVAGSGNVVAAKLQAIPMYNYPNFLNIFGNFMYIPICFAYILPASRYGWFGGSITPQQLNPPKRPFCVMGFLDCLAASMQVFSSVYLPGTLLVLLPQAAIPCSMLFSRYLLAERYCWMQYCGAAIVLVGILVVLEPVISLRHSPDYYCEAINMENDCTICRVESNKDSCLSHLQNDDAATDAFTMYTNSAYELADPDASAAVGGLCQWLPFDEAAKDDEFLIIVWSLVMIASCVPMTLSTVYKQIALGDGTELDPILLNGWIAVFQFFFSLVIAFPAGMFASPSVEPMDLPRNVWDGVQCYLGHGTVDTGCHPDTMCSFHSALYVNVCLFCNICYTFFMMLVLKYGSSSLLFLAMTLMVPIGNVAFALPFMPGAQPMHASDVVALAVIMSGLILYRFSEATTRPAVPLQEAITEHSANDSQDADSSDAAKQAGDSLREPLLQAGDI